MTGGPDSTGATSPTGFPGLRAEFTVEPFVAGEVRPHVQAAIDAAEASGCTVEIGPFGTTVEGDHDAVLTAVDTVLRAAFAAGATRFTLQVNELD